MTFTRRSVLASFGPLAASTTSGVLSLETTGAQATTAATENVPDDWRESYAYSLGMQAYVFGFPLDLPAELAMELGDGAKT